MQRDYTRSKYFSCNLTQTKCHILKIWIGIANWKSVCAHLPFNHLFQIKFFFRSVIRFSIDWVFSQVTRLSWNIPRQAFLLAVLSPRKPEVIQKPSDKRNELGQLCASWCFRVFKLKAMMDLGDMQKTVLKAKCVVLQVAPKLCHLFLYVHWLTQFLMTLFFCQQWHGPEALRYNTIFQCYTSIQTIHRYTVPLYKRPEEHNSPPNTKSTYKWIWAKLLDNESDNWILFSSKVILAVWKFLWALRRK